MSGMTLQVDENLVKPVIEREIQAAIVSVMDKMGDLIPQMVKSVLHTKVDSEGKVSNYSSENKYDMLEVTFKKAIIEATKSAVVEYIKKNDPILQKEIEKQIKAQSSGIATGLVQSLQKAAENNYRFSVVISEEK